MAYRRQNQTTVTKRPAWHSGSGVIDAALCAKRQAIVEPGLGLLDLEIDIQTLDNPR